MATYISRGVEIMNINYDFIPTIHNARKSLWVTLRYPAPHSLTYGSIVKLKATTPEARFPDVDFQIVDIIGTRVVLKPVIDLLDYDTHEDLGRANLNSNPGTRTNAIGMWTPSTHNPGTWGYTMKNWIDTLGGGYRNWTYGSGQSIGIMYW
jgi:hypothetical protein